MANSFCLSCIALPFVFQDCCPCVKKTKKEKEERKEKGRERGKGAHNSIGIYKC